MYRETKKKIVWLTFIQYVLYWDGLELNLQYLQGIPIFS